MTATKLLRDKDIRPVLIRKIVIDTWRDRVITQFPSGFMVKGEVVPVAQLERVLGQMYDAGELPGSKGEALF